MSYRRMPDRLYDDPDELAWFNEQMAARYGSRRVRTEKMPAATQRHYDNPRVVIKIVPQKIRTWDNAKIRLAAPA